MQLSDKVVAVTGGAQGIGKGIAHAAVFMAENDYFTGRSIDIDGGPRL
jgi:NAD(P)-dependent dehydrogenase (short-subunit alcohol dehydrogenase family)